MLTTAILFIVLVILILYIANEVSRSRATQRQANQAAAAAANAAAVAAQQAAPPVVVVAPAANAAGAAQPAAPAVAAVVVQNTPPAQPPSRGPIIWLWTLIALAFAFAIAAAFKYEPLTQVLKGIHGYLGIDPMPGIIAGGGLILFFLIRYGKPGITTRQAAMWTLGAVLVFMTVTWAWGKIKAGLSDISVGSYTGPAMNWLADHSLWILGAVVALAFLIVLARSEELQKSLSKIALALILVGGVSYAIYRGEQAIRAADYNPAARKASGGKEIVKDYTISTENPIKIEWAADSSTIVHLEFGKTVAGLKYWHQNRKPDDEAPVGIITPDGVENPPIKGDDPIWIAMIAPEGIEGPLEAKVEITQRLFPK